MKTLKEHLSKQAYIDFITTLIRSELDRHQESSLYVDTLTPVKNEEYILCKSKELLDYDYEADQARQDYCLKATMVEIWQYWLREILTKL